jgi:hypothetical protein
MSASFWLEAGLNTDDGTGQNSNTNNQASTQPVALEGITFNRRSTVSLAGNWGELRLGRDYVPQYNNRTQFDPFGNVGVSQTVVNNLAITGVTSSRASNTVAYFLPAQAGGFYGQVMYYMGENPSTAGATHRDGSGYGGRLGYVTGPFNVAVASGYTRYAAGGARQSNIGGQWDLPVVKLMGEYELETSGTTKAKGWMIGGLLPVGVGQIRLSYSRMTIERANAEPRSNKLALGYVHNLSKRTALYTNYAHVSNSAGASLALGGATTAANNASNGVDLGIRHSF